MRTEKFATKRQNFCRFSHTEKTDKRIKKRRLRLHPLFLLVGVWYCFKGELFLFLMSCLVALQHECAHAFAAAKLGYTLNTVVLMPFGAVIDGDLHDISLKDEIIVALCGPLCNLFTAALFAALWWFAPTMYAFTDTACFSSLSVALVNLLPAYPLDGGRVLRCVLARRFLKNQPEQARAERKAQTVCRTLTLCFAAIALAAFICTLALRRPNLSLLALGGFLAVGAFGNKTERATYAKMDFSCKDAIKKGVELRRVAVGENCPVKDALRYVMHGTYLVLEVYDERENKLFELPQNELSAYFSLAPTPYATLGQLHREYTQKRIKTGKNP